MEFIYGLGLAMIIVPLINYTIALAVIGRHTVLIALNICHLRRRVGKLLSILSKNRISPFLSVYLYCWTLLMAMAIPQLIYDISVWSPENDRLKSTYTMFWSAVSEL